MLLISIARLCHCATMKDARRIFPTRPNASDPSSLAHHPAPAGTELIGYGKSNEGLRLTILDDNERGNGDLQRKLTIHEVGWPNAHNSRLPERIGEAMTVAETKQALGSTSTMSFLRKYFLPLAALTEVETDAFHRMSGITIDEEELTEVRSDAAVPENRLRLSDHLPRERNSSLAREAKSNYCDSTDLPVCHACEDLFEDKYDMPYLEAHHKLPLGADDEVRQTTVADFDLLCANCRRAIHRMPAGSTLADLRELLTRTGWLPRPSRVTQV